MVARKVVAKHPDADDPRLVRHDRQTVVLGGFASPHLIAWSDPVGVVACSVLQVTGVLTIGARVPTVRPLLADWTQACGRARDGRWAMLHGLRSKTRIVRVYRANLGASMDLQVAKKRRIEFASVGFVGERVIAIPGDLGTHRRAFVVNAPTPYLQDGPALVPAPGLEPGAGGSADRLHGVVACGDGRDVVVWGGRMFELRGDRFERFAGFDLEPEHNSASLTTAASGTAGFWTIMGWQLVEVLPGAKQPRVALPEHQFRVVRPGPSGSLILEAVYATRERAALWLFDPATRKARPLGTPEGVDSRTAFYVAARRALALFADKDEGTAGKPIVLVPVP